MKRFYWVGVALVALGVLSAMQSCDKPENGEEEPGGVAGSVPNIQPLPGIFTVGVGPDGIKVSHSWI